MNIETLQKSDFPETLRNIPKQPDYLYIRGKLPPSHYKYLCVIGSRKPSPYGEDACDALLSGLRGYPIAVVSGLAFGIDSFSHEVALRAGLTAIAFPGSGLSDQVLYPQPKLNLAHRILENGGALLSKFPPEYPPADWTFLMRNELMAGISHATLIIEARAKSGTLSTATAALKFGREVLIVPGSIFSDLSSTPLALMKDGATPVTSSKDILRVLGLLADSESPEHDSKQGTLLSALTENLAPDEKKIVERLLVPISRDDLIRELALPAGYVNSVLVDLELRGLIKERDGKIMSK